MIWLCGDWHFCHSRGFIYEPRGFNSIEEMNETIVDRHNSIVLPEDDVYVLGDLMLNDNEKGIELIKQMNGKLHIAIGNHDTISRIELQYFSDVIPFCPIINGWPTDIIRRLPLL